MSVNCEEYSFQIFVPGEVLVLLSQLQELEPGMYVVKNVIDGWATLRRLIDDEATESLLVTDQRSTLPVRLLKLFMPIGLRLNCPA